MSLPGRCFLEFVGTFFLGLVIATAAVGGMALDLAPVAIGAVLTALIYMAGPHSGAHFNPAVTVAFWLRGTFPAQEIIPYIVVQCLGAVLAALTQYLMIESVPAGDIELTLRALGAEGGKIPDALQLGVTELLLTFALVLVILHVSSPPGQQGNPYFGIAVGLMVMGGIFAVGPISGAVFNPAILLSLAVLGVVSGIHGVVILTTTFAGAVLAALAFRAIHPTTEVS